MQTLLIVCLFETLQTLTLRLPNGGVATPVSVVYFRAGYTPADYFGEEEWTARALVEESNAAKCPTVGYQLAGVRVTKSAFLEG